MAMLSHLLLWIVVMMMAVLVIQRKQEKPVQPVFKPMMLFQSEHGAKLGERFPVSTVRTITDDEVNLVQGDRSTILLITSPKCKSCKELYLSIMPFKNQHNDRYRMVAIMLDDREEAIKVARDLNLTIPIVYMSEEEQKATQTEFMPFGYLLSAEGEVISKGLVGNGDQLELLTTWRPTPVRVA